MISLSKHVPILERENSFEKDRNITILGIRFNKDLHMLYPNMNTFLIHKETYNKLIGFLKPVDGQLEWQTLESNIAQLMMSEPHKIDNRKIHLLHEHVRKQWEDRLSYSDGRTLIQYNCLVGLTGKNHCGKIVFHNDFYGASQESDQTQLKKISYARYMLLCFTSLLICGVNNFFYKKVIAIEKIKSLKEFKEKLNAKLRRNG